MKLAASLGVGLRDTEEELSSFKKSSRGQCERTTIFKKIFFFDVDLFLVVIESVTILFLVSLFCFLVRGM